MQLQQALSPSVHRTLTHRHPSPCTSCVSRSLCLHDHLDLEGLDLLTSQYTQKTKVKAGDPIFRNGDSIHSLYTVRIGFIKIEYSLPNGHNQVNHFATNGDLIGTDGIANGKHQLDATALTDGELCSLNFNRIQSLMRDNPKIQRSVDCAMSRELNNTHEHLYSLGSHNVEQKLAFFILHLHNKLGILHSGLKAIRLPMSREDLRSYLGVTAESLSRAFTNLEKKGYFQVRNKDINNIDYEGLSELIER
jgi:CRP/FNR family transcriptional regulator